MKSKYSIFSKKSHRITSLKTALIAIIILRVWVIGYYIHPSHVIQVHTQTYTLGFISNLECADGSKAYLN
jgi:hypothetical protein